MHIVLKKVGAYENFMNKTNICPGKWMVDAKGPFGIR